MMDREWIEKLLTLERRVKELEREKADGREKETADVRVSPPNPRWKPTAYDEYYAVSDGRVMALVCGEDEVDERYFAVGGIFRDEAAAEFALKRLKVLAEMQEWAGEYGDPVSIAYYENDGKVEPIASLYPNRGEAVFATYEDAEGCIRAIGQERLKKYYFRVSEDEDDEKGSE